MDLHAIESRLFDPGGRARKALDQARNLFKSQLPGDIPPESFHDRRANGLHPRGLPGRLGSGVIKLHSRPGSMPMNVFCQFRQARAA